MGLRALIVGGAGFIGSHIAEMFANSGASNVVVADNFFLGQSENLAAIETGLELETFRIDAGDFSALQHVIALRQIDTIVNLAVVPLPTSLHFPSMTLTNNFRVTVNCCEIVRQGSAEKLVQFSSSEVYGSASFTPMSESHPFNPSTPYAASKVASDQTVRAYSHTFGLDALVVRPFNNFGPRQNSGSYAGIIPIVLNQVMKNEPIEIFGDGEQTRDYVFVRETADFVSRLIETELSSGEVVNICSGIEITVNQLVKEILEILGKRDYPVIHSAARPGDVRRHLGDNSHLKELTDSTPVGISKANLGQTIDWYLSRG